MTLVQCTSSHTGLSACENAYQNMYSCLRNAQHKEKVGEGDKSKTINARALHPLHGTFNYPTLFID